VGALGRLNLEVPLKAHMTLHQWLGTFALVLLVSFFVFAFRKGEKVRPSGREDRESVAGESSYPGGEGGHH
jgi:hypothetical protein